MSIDRNASKEISLSDIQAVQERFSDTNPHWIRELREAAAVKFQKIGLPTARHGNEEWKYTDVGPIAKGGFQPAVAEVIDDSGSDALNSIDLGGPSAIQLVFVNGRYSSGLSSVGNLPSGVMVMNLADAVVLASDLVRDNLSRYADCDSNGFTALNTACTDDGAFLYIPESTSIDEPIKLLFLTGAQGVDIFANTRVLIVADVNSKVSVVESFGCLSDSGRYFSNNVTEIRLADGANVNYSKIQQHSDNGYHVSTTEVALGRDSRFSSVNVDLGGKLVRNNLNVLTEDEGSTCNLNGLYMVNGNQHVDNQVIIDHAKPYTESRELYKGILDGKSRSVFHGSIIVREGAVKVNASQVDKNLLLSNEAEADTKPAFWVYCDDVKCGHGAACGQIDENSLFYLRSRGIDEKVAMSMLTRAFLSEVVDTVTNEALRVQISGLIETKLDSWLDD